MNPFDPFLSSARIFNAKTQRRQDAKKNQGDITSVFLGVSASRRLGVQSIVLMLSLVTALFACKAQAQPSQVEADARHLTAAPHRLAGTVANHDVFSRLRTRLEHLLGSENVLLLDFEVVQLAAGGDAILEAEGTELALQALRPNVVVPPVLAAPIEAPLVYLGRGELSDYAGRSVDGAVVALEYDCGENWERAFSRGAAAVVFLGDGRETRGAAKHAPVPLNLPRFYAPPQAAESLREDRARVVLRSLPVESDVADPPGGGALLGEGRNLVGFIPGTDPRGEALVVAANVDTFGTVPTRSPGTRGAANVAGLLRLAEALQADPPRRDVWLVFLDAGAQRQRGARMLYDAVTMATQVHEQIVAEHRDEASQLAAVVGELERWRAEAGQAGRDKTLAPALRDRLTERADWMRADVDRQRQTLRRSGQTDATDALAELEDEVATWDRVRRFLHQGEPFAALAEADRPTFVRLLQRTALDFQRRAIELERAQRRDAQRGALRSALSHGTDTLPRVVLHVDLNLSDAGPTWSAVAGEWSARLYEARQPAATADAPGFHNRVLGALDAIAERAPAGGFARLDRGPLTDVALAEAFVPGRFVTPGGVAGGHGLYHVALMTGHDARVRDGQPSDTPANFDFENFESQLDEAIALIGAAADDPALSLRPSFSPMVVAQRGGWDGRRATGPLVTRRVTGGLSENRPAAGALVALWPGDKNDADASWRVLSHEAPADYQAFDLVPTNRHGRFEVVGLRSDISPDLTTFAFDADEAGGLAAVPTQTTLVQPMFGAMGVSLIAGEGYGLTWWGGGAELPAARRRAAVMRASSDAPYRPTLSLGGQAGRHQFWVLADRAVEPGLKVFAERGPVALGIEEAGGDAAGVALERFARPTGWAAKTAEDLWRLNEGRLSGLRTRGVTSPDLEVLHAEGGRLLQDANDFGLGGMGFQPVVRAQLEISSAETRAGGQRQAGSPPHSEAGSPSHSKPQAADATREALRSVALSAQVYPRLRSTMDDLVQAIVVLLLLSIPFAFALERLLVGAAGVYGRIAGFVAAFMVTFGLLYATHPGFAVASTPAMIFLAFAIVLLSCLVIWVLVRRFQTELATMQGRPPAGDGAGGARGVGVAVSMGISTMRRRPTRTTLTAITVVMLTFTVLCFASVRREIGVRSAGLGPVTESMPSRAVMVRALDAGELGLALLDVLPGDETQWWASWWRVPESDGAGDDRPITVARVDDGRTVRLGGVLGIDPAVVERWPAWGGAFAGGDADAGRALRDGEVFLPASAMSRLDLSPGDAVMVDGRRLLVAGATDAARLGALRQVDGESWLPVDASAQAAAQGGSPGAGGGGGAGGGVVGGRLIRLSPQQVAVASNDTVRRLGGGLRSVTRWVDEEADPGAIGRGLAEMASTPVWVTGGQSSGAEREASGGGGGGGSERLLLGNITRVSGVWRLVAPVLLGGLIIFGTLLGSIADRQREIYTFSALGLGPRHVGMLFFAEAAVYAVVGGLGGQLLAQVVALGASWLAEWGWMRPVSINFASTQSLFAIGVVMLTVMVSAIYPAIRASKSANPGLARAWVMPAPEEAPDDNHLRMMFPFTVSAYDLTGVVAFLAEHFRQHADAGLGPFAASDVAVERDVQDRLRLRAEVALAPFDLGVTQHLTLTGVPSDIPGVDEVAVHLVRQSGTRGDWVRANRVFIKRLRRQFLVWRTLPAEAVEAYRLATLEALGENPAEQSGNRGLTRMSADTHG